MRAFMTELACILAAGVVAAAQPVVLMEWVGEDFNFGYVTSRRTYDEFYTVAPDHDCLSENWFYGETYRVPLDIITFNHPYNTFVYYFNTSPDFPVHLRKGYTGSPHEEITDPRFRFYLAATSTGGYPNPQFRGDGDFAPNLIWLNCNASENYPACYAMPTPPSYSSWHVFVWPKREWLNGADSATSVRFGDTDTMMLRTTDVDAPGHIR
ncbi:MAG: hypothetical protein GF331_03955, partial [Chitinivibrionales bacterium]|nr:hypothetical protein [Chitinivibrionales bacterium]